ncbi:MAG: hypothetical protein K8R68_07430 [Bacteroidales bacterium]|nr:hypothetical protein [Bacteroidales bacterium]
MELFGIYESRTKYHRIYNLDYRDYKSLNIGFRIANPKEQTLQQSFVGDDTRPGFIVEGLPRNSILQGLPPDSSQ